MEICEGKSEAGFFLRYSHIALDYRVEACNNYKVQKGSVGGVWRLAEVRIQEGESLENALRRFKRKVQQEDIIQGGQAAFLLLEAWPKKACKGSTGAQA